MTKAPEIAPLIFKPTGEKLLKNASAGTKYYVTDTANSLNTLFISRGKFRDILIQANSKLNQFQKVYETRLTERIFSASAMPGKKWFLIVLLMFGDGIDPRPCYRSIFVTVTGSKIQELPVSTKTYYPQNLSWAYSSDAPVFLHTSFVLEKPPVIGTYDLNYDPPTSTFSVIPKKVFDNYLWFSTGMMGQMQHTYIIMSDQNGGLLFTDRTKADLYPKTCTLPNGTLINANTEFKTFGSGRSSNSQKNSQRCLLQTTLEKLTIILPTSLKKAEMPLDYVALTPQSNQDNNEILHFITSSDMKDANLLCSPLDISMFPTSRLPFSFYKNDFFLVGAPFGHVTGFLLDQADRVRASFTTPIPQENIFLHSMTSLNDKASFCLYQETGEIYTCEINYDFFVKRDPRFILPLLHTYITSSDEKPLAPLITKRLLRTFWNGEFFNEALLLLFNARQPKHAFADKICSTFIDAKRLEDSLFIEFAERPRNEYIAEPFKSFPELVRKLPHALIELLPQSLQDLNSLLHTLCQMLDDAYFDTSSFALEVQFESWLQIQALKHSLEPNEPITSKRSRFSENVSPEILSIWGMREMMDLSEIMPIPKDSIIPAECPDEDKMNSVERIWWFLRTQKVQMTETQDNLHLTNLFQYVEQVTNKTNDSGPAFFSIHQFLLEPEMDHPIFGR